MEGFIGREREMALLEKEYGKHSDLILVTGRRRIGKTRLVKEFAEGKDSLYFLATNTVEKDMMEEMWDCLSRNAGPLPGRPGNWAEVFQAVVDCGKKVLIIDEFSYMAKMSDSFLVRFQGIFDEILKGSGVMTILCGSHMSVMNGLSEDRESPLYGRFDRRIILRQLEYGSIPSTGDAKHDIAMYALHGGIPRYMELLDDADVRENIIGNIMDPSSMMFSDPLVLLQSDAGGSNVYLAILKAVANGNHRLSQISSALEIKSSTLGPYLSRLMEIGLIDKESPVTEPSVDRSKRCRYYVSDCFTRFWFRFVYPYRSDIMRGNPSYAIKRLDEDFIDKHVSFVFEDVCRARIAGDPGAIGFVPERIGRYWSRNVEVDIMAIDTAGKRAFLGECKHHSNGPSDNHELNELRKKASMIPEIEGYEISYGLFSVSGFDDGIEGAILFDMRGRRCSFSDHLAMLRIMSPP